MLKPFSLGNLIFPLIILAFACTNKPSEAKNEKETVEIITSDIDNFWTAFHSTKTQEDTMPFHNYFKNGSLGLIDFANAGLISPPDQGKGNVQEMILAAFKYKNFFESIEKNTRNISALRDSINFYCLKLQELYYVSKFPKVYFIMGRFGAAGTVSDNGLLLSAEFLSIDAQSKLEELEGLGNLAQFVKPKEFIPTITIHELIHFLQPYNDSIKTVLDNAIIEGGADFVAYLVVGKTANETLYEYGRKHEKELWSRFKQDLDSANLGLWFYDYFESKNELPDLGYFMGYKICESYYNNSTDKKKAIKEIIEAKDFKNFLVQSKYESNFEEE